MFQPIMQLGQLRGSQMINILLNIFKVDDEWCFKEFKNYIKPEHRVTVIPFSFKEEHINSSESWQSYYGENKGAYFHGIVNSFLSYGVKYENITWINYFTDSKEIAKNKILNSDILFFLGGLPDKMMIRLEEFDLVNNIEEHNGIIMGYSAGAMIQIENYHITPDKDYSSFGYYKGMKMIDKFDIEVHFEHTDLQLSSIERVKKETGKPVYAIEDTGAIIVENNRVKLVGNVHYFQ